ncbi:hypothetical protein ACP4OV_005400 [Aristida adscensionis]
MNPSLSPGSSHLNPSIQCDQSTSPPEELKVLNQTRATTTYGLYLDCGTMAADIWTINLQCHGAAPGQEEHVQTKMDRDKMCFFNLIELIKQYGYKTVDYLYYKRWDTLVPINLDADVIEMLEENESRKKVSLLVTRERLATMVPTKFNTKPTKSAANKSKGKRKKKQQLNLVETKAQYATDVDQQYDDDIRETSGECDKVAKRKGTVLTHVWDLPEQKRIIVKCNQLGQPIGKEGGLLGQFLGTIARNGSYCPVHVKDWRKVKNDSAQTILQLIQTKFLYPRSTEKWILKSIGRDWRKYKATLKKKFFNPKKKRSALYKLCPNDIDEDQWKALVNYWKSAEGKALSEKNKQSREMKQTTHTAGTKSYARWSEDLRQADPEKKQPHRAKVYLATHRKRVNGTNQAAVQLENMIENQPELADNSEGRVAWEGDALHQVLGKEKPGQLHGMGLLPIPKQVFGRTTHHFKDINIATVDGSPSDLETHMLEEINQLKEHASKQDKVIAELRQEKGNHENEEPIEVWTDHGIFQNHAVYFYRKRVHCVEPDAAHHELYQDDENNKDIPYQEAEPSSPQCSTNGSRGKQNSSDSRIKRKRKNQQGVLQETTSMAQQVSAQDNAVGHKRSKYTQPRPIKVGSIVLLKTASYRNRAIVAYATILSSSPKESVGGVEIGKQFYKVRVNHPIIQDEPLVRPMNGYKTIGDAHSKGAAIAWPSICVEMING